MANCTLDKAAIIIFLDGVKHFLYGNYIRMEFDEFAQAIQSLKVVESDLSIPNIMVNTSPTERRLLMIALSARQSKLRHCLDFQARL